MIQENLEPITALIIKKEKVQYGYILRLIQPIEGFISAHINLSKSISHQVIQPFNLVEIFLAKNKYSIQNSMYLKIKEITSIFSFAPPFMDFFHFFAFQNLLLKLNSLFFYQNKKMENKQIFVMLSTLLTLSPSIKTTQQSEILLSSLFIKWNLILKIHEEILYCANCGKKIMNKTGFQNNLFYHTNPQFICYNCSEKIPQTLGQVPALLLEEIWSMIYFSFQDLLLKQEISSECEFFFERYLKYYFNFSTDELFSKKNNPFLNL